MTTISTRTVADSTARIRAKRHSRSFVHRRRRHRRHVITAGRLTQVTDIAGNVTRYAWNDANRDLCNLLRVTTDPLGRRYFYTYDDRGNRTSVRDPEGNVSLYAYDPLYNQITSHTDPTGRSTHHAYTAQGKLRQTTDPAGNATRYTWNDRGQMATATDALGNVTHFNYDEHGNLQSTTDPLGHVSHFVYDQANRLTQGTDPLGRTTRYHYDTQDRLIRIEDAAGGSTQITHDPKGRVESVRDAKGAIIETNRYDPRGRLIERKDAAGRSHLYSYDGNGNLIAHTDPKGQIAQYRYDELDRLIQAQDADGRYTHYYYDLAGRLTQVDDSESGTTRYGYDSLDRLTQELSARGLIAYAYDAAGRLTERRINGTEVTRYDYDPAGRITRIEHNGRAATYQYDAAGRITEKRLPNGIVQSYSYDAAGQITRIRHTHNGNDLERMDYRYDPAGQIVSRTRQSAASHPETPFTASYDADNRMLTYNGRALTYDPNGNLTKRDTEAGTVTYTWDARNRLTRIEGPHGTASFKYDHAGRRIEKTVNGHTVGYLYDGPQAIAELQGNALGAVYHTGLAIDEVLARYTPSRNRYLIADALGSVIAETDEQAAIKTTYAYSPYGEVKQSGDESEDSDNPLQYTGRENDDTGLYYYRARYYDPQLKRFISVDPIGLEGGINVYGYVNGNPLGFVDPHGLFGTPYRPCQGAGCLPIKWPEPITHPKCIKCDDKLYECMAENLAGAGPACVKCVASIKSRKRDDNACTNCSISSASAAYCLKLHCKYVVCDDDGCKLDD